MLDLPHVAARIFGTPLLIARAKLDVILGVVAPRLAGTAFLPRDPAPEPAGTLSVLPGAIAVVSVVGTLVARSSYLDAESGLLSYAMIGDEVEAAISDDTVRAVILDIDSCGGEVGGLFDLIDRLAALKLGSGKPLWAIANENALSAAYAIASVADRIYVTQTGEVGSIGVVAAHVDESGADTQAGLAWSFIFAGEHKVDGNAHEPLSGRARTAIQDDVDRLYELFCNRVATSRRMSSEAVRATQAATFRGELAIRAGLADRLGTLDLAVSELGADLDTLTVNPTITALPSRSPSMSTEPTTANPGSPPAAPAEVPATPASPTAPPPAPAPAPAPANPPAPASADALRAEYADIAALAAQAARLGVSVDAADAMRKGISADALRRTVLETLASRTEASSVIAVAPAASGGGDSPIVKRARERAAATART